MHLLPIATRRKLLSTGIVHFGAVIPEIDIWRAAQLMVKSYGSRRSRRALLELPNSHSLATMTERRPGTGSWRPSLNWPTPRLRGRYTDRQRDTRASYR